MATRLHDGTVVLDREDERRNNRASGIGAAIIVLGIGIPGLIFLARWLCATPFP